jgi:chromate transporter
MTSPPGPANTLTQPSPLEGEGSKQPTELDLFLGFLWASVRGFGGVFVMGRRMLVEERQWLTPEEFVELLGVCQFLPGANIVNLSVAVGQRFRGWKGSIAALAGILAAPAAVSVMLAPLFMRYATVPQVAHAMGAVAAAAAGLIVGTALKMAEPIFKKDWVLALPIALGTLVLAAFLRWPLPVVLLLMAGAGSGLAWARRSRSSSEVVQSARSSSEAVAQKK